MLLQLPILVCLLGAAASQKTFYCNSVGTGAIRDDDFYLITRPQGESSYPPGLECNFVALAGNNSRQYYVEILESQLGDEARIALKSGGTTMLSVLEVLPEATTFLTREGSLQVLFEVPRRILYKRRGVRLRVRAVTKTQCPPSWHRLNSTCYGRSGTAGSLSYRLAQRSCNRMLSNLLHVPSDFSGGMTDLLRQLPRNFTASYAWIGVTDIASRLNYVWLNGSSFRQTWNISCHSGGGHSSCYTNERCAAAIYPFRYAMYMSDCSSSRNFICYMPQGGASAFFPVPDDDVPESNSDAGPSIGVIIAVIIFGLLVCCGCWRRYKPSPTPQSAPFVTGADVYYSDGSVVQVRE